MVTWGFVIQAHNDPAGEELLGAEIVAEEIAESEMLFLLEILTALEQQPAGLLEHRIAAQQA